MPKFGNQIFVYLHIFYKFWTWNCSTSYCTRAIITRGLYVFYWLFEGQKRFFKEVFPENSAFMYG